MLLRRGLLSRNIPNTVTIPLLGSFKASNGAEPSVNTGCTLTDTGLYIPAGCVEYKISDLYPKPWNKITMELDLMYTKTNREHGWFDFFDFVPGYHKTAGVEYNIDPNELLMLFDHITIAPIPKNIFIHVIVSADFSQGSTIPHGDVIGLDTKYFSWRQVVVSKPSGLRFGHFYFFDGWKGYVKNVKVTFE